MCHPDSHRARCSGRCPRFQWVNRWYSGGRNWCSCYTTVRSAFVPSKKKDYRGYSQNWSIPMLIGPCLLSLAPYNCLLTVQLPSPGAGTIQEQFPGTMLLWAVPNRTFSDKFHGEVPSATLQKYSLPSCSLSDLSSIPGYHSPFSLSARAWIRRGSTIPRLLEVQANF